MSMFLLSLLVSDTDILVTIFVHAQAKDLSSLMLHCVTVSHITLYQCGLMVNQWCVHIVVNKCGVCVCYAEL